MPEPIVTISGPFDEETRAGIVREVHLRTEVGRRTERRLTKILIELTTNVCRHSCEGDGVGEGVLSIFDDGPSIRIVCSNGVSGVAVESLRSLCDEINTLDRDGRRVLKTRLSRLPRSGGVGGNIGLVEISLTSDLPLDYKIEDGMFRITVSVNKIEKRK